MIINFDKGVTLSSEPTELDIALPPMTFSKGFTVRFYESDEIFIEKSISYEVLVSKESTYPITFDYNSGALSDDYCLISQLDITATPQNPRNSEGDLLVLDDNKIMFVYSKFLGGNTDFSYSDIVCRMSFDGGMTWSDDRVIVKNNPENQNVMSASLLKLKDGGIALFYLVSESMDDSHLVMRISYDEGKTWSNPTNVLQPGKWYVVNNSRVERLRTGRIVIPVAYHMYFENGEFNLDASIFYMYSDDEGKSWQKSDILSKCEDGAFQMEPGLVELADGRLLMYIRTNAGYQYFSFSTNLGQTWSTFEKSSLQSPAAPAKILQYPYGRKPLVAIWNNGNSRRTISMAVSYDNGTTWEGEILLTDKYAAYPALRFLDDDEMLVAFSCSGLWQNDYCVKRMTYKYLNK